MGEMILKETVLVVGDRIGTAGSLFYNFPSMEILSNGEWLVTCREIRSLDDPKGKIQTRRSGDRGKTWTVSVRLRPVTMNGITPGTDFYFVISPNLRRTSFSRST